MRFIAYLLLALTALVTLPGLGERDLWPPDEARYGCVATEMAAEGRLAALHLNGENYGDKPPGYFWLVRAAAFFHGAIDEWTLRLPSVLGAMIFVLALGLAVGRATGAHAGFLAGLLPLATHSFAWQARYGQLDLLFAGLGAWAALDGFRALEVGRPSLLVRAGFVLGCAVLIKGPLVLLVIPVLGLWRLIGRPERREGIHFTGSVIGMVFGILLPVAAWLGLAAWEAGFAYLRDELVLRNVVERVEQGLAHVRPWSYYLKQVPIDLAPWLLFTPLLALPSVRALLGRPGRRLAAFAFLWLLIFLVAQSAFPGKRSIYAFLFHGPLYIFAAQAAAAGVSDKGSPLARSISTAVIGLVLVVALVLGALFGGLGFNAASFAETLDLLHRTSGHDVAALLTTKGLPKPADAAFPGFLLALRWSALPFILGSMLVLISLLRRRLDLALDQILLAFALAFLAVLAQLSPFLDHDRSRRDFAAELDRRVGLETVAFYRHVDEGILYYFGRQMPELRGVESSVALDLPRAERLAGLQAEARGALETWLALPDHRFLLIRSEDRLLLGPELAGRTWSRRLAARIGSDKDYELLEFEPKERGL